MSRHRATVEVVAFPAGSDLEARLAIQVACSTMGVSAVGATREPGRVLLAIPVGTSAALIRARYAELRPLLAARVEVLFAELVIEEGIGVGKRAA